MSALDEAIIADAAKSAAKYTSVEDLKAVIGRLQNFREQDGPANRQYWSRVLEPYEKRLLELTEPQGKA